MRWKEQMRKGRRRGGGKRKQNTGEKKEAKTDANKLETGRPAQEVTHSQPSQLRLWSAERAVVTPSPRAVRGHSLPSCATLKQARDGEKWFLRGPLEEDGG